MTQEQANTLVINADENILQGWLDLQRVWFDNRNDPDMMKADRRLAETLSEQSGRENAANAVG